MSIVAPTIVIGAGDGTALADISDENTDIIILPGESIGAGKPGWRVHRPKTLPDALRDIRETYGQHQSVTMLAGARVIDTLPVAESRENTRKEWSKAIQDQLGSMFDALGNCPVDSWQGARNIIHNGELIQKWSHSGHFRNKLHRVPAICLAAGPSAQQHLTRLKLLSESHIIFACDAMLNACMDHGFAPHYTTAVERIPNLHKMFDRHGDCGTTLIAPPVLHPSSFARFTNPGIMWMAADDIYKWIDPTVEQTACGRSAGTLNVAAALHAGCSPIYLVGHDLAYKDGKTHADGFTRIAAPEAYLETSEWDPYFIQHTVPKNGGGTVRTTGAWNAFRSDIETIISFYPGQSVVNVNRDEGAVVLGTGKGWLPLLADGVVTKPSLPPSGITDLRARIPSILEDLDRLTSAATSCTYAIECAESGSDLDLIAKRLAIGNIVSRENAWLFRYALRNIYNSLKMRLYLRQSEGISAQASALRILTRTLPGMCVLMRSELS